jgi:very-short-patch-repair endonuclease
MKLSALDQLARRQHGVITRTQADIGIDTWHRAIAAGNLVELHRGVARLVGTADSPTQRIMAGVLAVGPDALASHRSAAFLHGIPTVEPPPVDVIARPMNDRLGRARSVVGLEGVVVHRPRDLGRLRPHRIDGIPCTNVLRTLVDLGSVAPEAVHGAVGHVLTTQSADLNAIECAIVEHAAKGRTGIAALRSAIDDWSLDAKPADSVLEPAMKRLCVRYGLPPVEFHAHVGGREVDFRIIGTPIVIECDGWRYHGRDRDQFERDRANDAEFAAHGWIVLRFTYRKVTTRPADVARQIRATIDRWARHPAPDAA